MNDEQITAFLDSPAGRRAVEAMNPRYAKDYGPSPRDRARLHAALRDLLNDTCQTCGGAKYIDDSDYRGVTASIPCPNPDCKNGKVAPALKITEQANDELRQAVYDAYESERLLKEEHRAQIATEYVKAFRALAESWREKHPDPEGPGTRWEDFAADFIERRERERG